MDWWRGTQYSPSAAMVEIRDNLELTGRGEFLFNALQPALNEADEFNANCHQEASETAVLGCYTNGQVRVYNITNSELEGILEVTTAHELLHAVWARMNASERQGLADELAEVLAENQEILGEELETYEASEQQEEAYVRAGTEIANLPEELEKHFANYFSARQRIVDYYNSYIAVFNEKKERAEALEAELPEMREEIFVAIDAYETSARDLQGEIQEFNQCAQTVNCFKTQAEFASRREALLGEQGKMQAENDRINQMIADYNAKIDEYNRIVEDSRKLGEEINSNSLTEVKF